MNLEDVTDAQTTTKKMRKALRRRTAKEEVRDLSKKKNPNPDARSVDADTSVTDDTDVAIDSVMTGHTE